MPSNRKKHFRQRMAKTGETYQAVLQSRKAPEEESETEMFELNDAGVSLRVPMSWMKPHEAPHTGSTPKLTIEVDFPPSGQPVVRVLVNGHLVGSIQDLSLKANMDGTAAVEISSILYDKKSFAYAELLESLGPTVKVRRIPLGGVLALDVSLQEGVYVGGRKAY